MKSGNLLLTLFLFGIVFSAFSQPQVELQIFASGLTNPLGIAHAGDDRLFVVEQGGLIRIVEPDGTVNATPFLDLTGIVSQDGGERGLLGLAFHPGYEQNGWFFVNYTRATDGNTVIARYTVDSSNPDQANSGSEVVLFDIDQPNSNHNGGQLFFGPNGYLFISLGDGGGSGDPGDNAQNPGTLLGKMLRIDVDVQDAPYYSVPDDNPFVDDEATLDEIWDMGLRNAWRNSFDRYTGDLWIADVGQEELEEINFEPANTGGFNYGWNCYEGDQAFDTEGCESASAYEFPVYTYSHPAGGCASVTGGYVYRGALYNGLFGHYLFGDYCTGDLFQIVRNNDEFTTTQLGTFETYQFTSFGEDQYGELYVAYINEGQIRKVVETSDCNPVARIMETGFPVDPGPDNTYTLHAFYHPSLEYQWYQNGDLLSGETAPSLEVSEESVYTVEVLNPANGCQSTSPEVEVSFNTSSIAGLQADDLYVYPNPAQSIIYIEGLPNVGTTQISLLEESGKVLLEKECTGTQECVFRTPEIHPGIYLLRFRHNQEQIVRKVMITTGN